MPGQRKSGDSCVWKNVACLSMGERTRRNVHLFPHRSFLQIPMLVVTDAYAHSIPVVAVFLCAATFIHEAPGLFIPCRSPQRNRTMWGHITPLPCEYLKVHLQKQISQFLYLHVFFNHVFFVFVLTSRKYQLNRHWFIHLKKAVYLLKTSSFALSLIHCLIHWGLYNWQIHACVPCFTVNSYSWLRQTRGQRSPLFSYLWAVIWVSSHYMASHEISDYKREILFTRFTFSHFRLTLDCYDIEPNWSQLSDLFP